MKLKFVAMLALAGILGSGAAIYGVCASQQQENFAVAEKAQLRSVTFMEETQSLQYRDTVVLNNLSDSTEIGRQTAARNTYAVYNDEDENTYYLNEKNELCGFQKKSYYGMDVSADEQISKETAIQKATEYLESIFTDFDKYSLILCEYAECDKVYQLQFCYLVQNIATDDMINVYIQPDGELGAFMALNRGIYQNMAIDQNLLQQAVRESNQANAETRYISLDENGPVLRYTYMEENISGEDVAQQSAVSLKAES